MIVDQEWGALRDAWLTGTGRPEAVRAGDALLERARLEVRRRSRRILFATVFEVILTGAFLFFSGLLAAVHPQTVTLVWAAAIWVFAGWALAFSLWNRRGLWRPETESTRCFVGISIRRREAEIRAVRFGFRLLAAELAFVAAFTAWKSSSGWTLSLSGSLVFFGALCAVSALISAFLVLRGRRLRAELAEWREFESSSAP